MDLTSKFEEGASKQIVLISSSEMDKKYPVEAENIVTRYGPIVLVSIEDKCIIL
jgi:hypothetical protein